MNKSKRKETFIFILCLILIILGILKGTTKIIKLNNPEEKKRKEETTKLKQLNNINKKLDYFNYDYIDRYLSYKNNNKTLSTTQIIKNVNMNLDKNFYENPKRATKLNSKEILVNKYYYLKEDYIPYNLETIETKYALSNMKLVDYAKDAFIELALAAKKENLTIIAMSTYRSYKYQENLYNKYVENDSVKKADTYSGRPGHSEHQTGLAVDVFNKKEDYTKFEKTKEFTWMQNHAHEYGFILRFPKNKENETGYQYESWHYRYVGKEIAGYIKKHNISYEEYYATKIKDC